MLGEKPTPEVTSFFSLQVLMNVFNGDTGSHNSNTRPICSSFCPNLLK
jgi:hypothetical protein